jgi:hypothetical protein
MLQSGEQLKVSELDFEAIKENIIDYFKSSGSEFTDWDFESSNLNNLIDVLAYNTHYNAVTAHMAVNESFIDSAQLRSSIVSAAKLLGYVPRSYSAPIAILDGVFEVEPAAPEEYVIPKGSIFSTQYEGSSYSFVVLDDIIRLVKTSNGGNFYYETTEDSPIIVREGSLVTRTFSVDASDDGARYEIIDENVDINTLSVRVYPTTNKSEGSAVVFNRYINIGEVNKDSSVYFVSENSFGRYEIYFGNGIFGKKLTSGQTIELEYLTTRGQEANGLNSSFIISSINDNSNPIIREASLGLNQQNGGKVFGGSNKESNNELKINAINSFATQNRAVTADDYRSLIVSKFGYIQSASVWGGEDNIPPEYGKIFIALDQFTDGDEYQKLSDSNKAEILDYLQSKKILALQPKIVDAKYINIVLDVLFKYDTNVTSLVTNEMQSAIENSVIIPYNNNFLNKFDTIFRHSQFVGAVDNYSRAVLNTHVRVYIQQSIDIPDDSSQTSFTLEFGVPLTTDDNKVLVDVTSNKAWTENGEKLFLADEVNPDSSRERLLYIFKILPDNTTQKIRNVGNINLETGIMKLRSIFSDEPIKLKILVHPLSNDVVGNRNFLLRIDKSSSRVIANPDEIARGGATRAIDYNAFPRER